MQQNIFPITGVVQHYAWGGNQYIPQLLRINNQGQKPYAELWMGTHERGPSKIKLQNQDHSLADWLRLHPTLLGSKVQSKFQGKLPFLFKVLDVRQMLSIQSHPTKKQAEIGFRKEEDLGIPLDANHRNFKDDNHKPEVMVALSPFWLLHGFKPKKDITNLLNEVSEFHPLKPHFANRDMATLYEYVMTMPQSEVDRLLRPLKKRLEKQHTLNKSNKNQADFWALRAFKENSLKDGGIDRGIFSIYFFNLVSLNPGEGIFQDAGIPHAYLEGINMELMANSDNVFRGGLTSKHIDVSALMSHLVFAPIKPNINKGEHISNTEIVYKTPAVDFELSKIDLHAGQVYQNFPFDSPQILIAIKGEARLNQTMELKKGQICFVGANSQYQLTADQETMIFKATVP